MEARQQVTLPENRTAIKEITAQALGQIEPQELAVAQGLIDPLINMAAEGQTASATKDDKAGGLGGVDLFAVVVVPIVVTVVSNLITELGKAWIEEWQKSRQKNPEAAWELIQVKEEQVEVVVQQTGSARARKQVKVLTTTINQALLTYLESK